MANGNKFSLSRRDFLKVSGTAMGGLLLPNSAVIAQNQPQDFIPGQRIARVAVGMVNVRSTPRYTQDGSNIVGQLYQDAVEPWLREVVGSFPLRHSQRWVETPRGYIWSPMVQPTSYEPQTPVTELPTHDILGRGMWVEVTAPYVNVSLANATPTHYPTQSQITQFGTPRLYHSQVLWVDDLQIDETGQVWYLLKEHFGYDSFWGQAENFRPFSYEDVAPISPEIEDKVVVVNLHRQSLSAYEEGREVFFCRISSGKLGEDTQSPVGSFRIFRKMLSTHMAGNASGNGWDLLAIGFTSFFASGGVAIHSTYWHNNYGERSSHGCINVRPADAQWLWRWTHPAIGYDPGDYDYSVNGGLSSQIRVIEG